MHLKNFSMHVFHALLRKTILVDCAQNGLVSTSSYWLAQGLPHPAVDLVLASLQKCFPCDWRTLDVRASGLSVVQQLMLTNNAVHWSAVGCCLIHKLAGTRKDLILLWIDPGKDRQ